MTIPRWLPLIAGDGSDGLRRHVAQRSGQPGAADGGGGRDPSRIEMNGSIFHAETFGVPGNPVIVFLHGVRAETIGRCSGSERGSTATAWPTTTSWSTGPAQLGLSKRHDKEC